MLKLYIFWGTFVVVVIGIAITLVMNRQHARHRQQAASQRTNGNGAASTAAPVRAAAAPTTGMPKLMCMGGSHRGHRFAIPPKGLSIGRAHDNDVVIVDGRISAHHAWIGMVGGQAMLRDYQSLKGTFLNADLDARVSEVVLAAGDVIHFGGDGGEPFCLVFE